MQMNNTRRGHITALITIIIWGTTFISTKILLKSFSPIEILFLRFLLGLALLAAIYPKRLIIKDKKQELTIAMAGLSGICLYYMFENIALTYTTASNVGVITSTAPFFTAVLARIFVKSDKKLNLNFIIGFCIAIAGICIISFNGEQFEINPTGDILAITAAFIWAVYSLLAKKISGYGYNTIQVTRRMFIYGLIFMIPFLFVFDFRFEAQKLLTPENAFNLLYLGLLASAVCFVTWNYAVKRLGAVKTSVYIYVVPVITVITSVIVLHEQITLISAIGIGITLTGLILSQSNFKAIPHK